MSASIPISRPPTTERARVSLALAGSTLTWLTLAALTVAGLALAELTVAGPSRAGTPAHNEQVVLANETNAQADGKSAVSGTGQVTSYDGRFVVFSTAVPLVAIDTNDIDDVYLRDTADKITILVSQKGGEPGNDASFEPTISNDGRHIAFTTWATNLVRDQNGTTLDVVVRDMFDDRISLASTTTNGRQFRKNSFAPVISGDGNRVSFQSFAPFGSADRDKLEDVYVRDVGRHWTRQVSLTPKGTDVRRSVLNGDISDDGSLVTFGDANDLWVREVNKDSTRRLWHEPDSPPCQHFPSGSAGRPAISGNGTYVAFSSCATKLPGPDTHQQLYRMHLTTGDIRLITRTGRSNVAGDSHSFLPSLSRSGRYVGFGSEASNLAGPDSEASPHAYVADLKRNTIVRASRTADGTDASSRSASTAAAISGDGRTLVYETYASNLVPGDQFDWQEVMVWRS